MRIKYLICLISSLIYLTGFSQKIELQDSELTDVLCKSWLIQKIIINGEVAELGEFSKDEVHVFKANNTFSGILFTENEESVSWVYNKEKKCVELFEDNSLIGTIESINSEQLIYLPYLDEEAKVFIQRLELHLIPLEE